jgi:hypothetical protein
MILVMTWQDQGLFTIASDRQMILLLVSQDHEMLTLEKFVIK